jgi:hypothetical protein
VNQYKHILSSALLAGGVTIGALNAPAQAQQLTDASYLTTVTIAVLPVAQINITSGSLLYLKVPPAGSTIPSSGVTFSVTGNASATLQAEPSAFVAVPGEGIIGKAVLNGEEVGYKLELRFPSIGMIGSLPQYAALPQFQAGPTVPPLTVNLMASGGTRAGVLHMEAHPNWTPTGGIPLPGIYVGSVVLTLTASN